MKYDYFIHEKYKRAAGYTMVPKCAKDGKRICIEGGLKCYGCPDRSEDNEQDKSS